MDIVSPLLHILLKKNYIVNLPFVERKQKTPESIKIRESCTFKFILFYKKIYFNTNKIAKIYISGVIFLALPQQRLITTYEITPNTIPSEML